MKDKISVQDFISEFLSKKIANTKINDHAIEDFIRSKLEIIEYLPFQKKREVVETIVDNVVRDEDGVKKADSISQHLCFVVGMLCSHTNLTVGDNPAEDYDALSKNGLLEPIIIMFQKSYLECEVMLKMAVADELANNNLNVIVGKFLNGILGKLDGVVDIAKSFAKDADLSKILEANINKEDVAKLVGLLDKLK